jgi:PAS domain S-box-containing protein
LTYFSNSSSLPESYFAFSGRRLENLINIITIMSGLILLVDDEHHFRNSLKHILCQEGYEVETAASGAESFARIRAKKYAAVLLDLVLPDLDGLEIAEFLTSHYPACAVIVLTGQATVNSAIKAIRLGCDDYLTKPCQPEQVFLTLKRAIDNKALKKELRISINKYQRLAEATWEGIAFFSPEGITEVNEQFCELFAIDEQEAKNHTLNDFVPGLRFPISAQYVQNPETRQVVETTAIRKNGETFPVEIRLKNIFDNGRPLWVVAVRDITRRLQEELNRSKLEERLSYAMRMESIGLMAGSVAHDLNNILSSIVTFPELLLLRMPADAKYREDITRIKKAGQQAAAVVTDLLTIARGSTCKMENLNLNHILEEYRQSLDYRLQVETSPKITIDIDLAPHLPNTHVSPVHITKCIVNLVRNGVEAIASCGTISIHTAARFLDEALQGYDVIPPGQYATISVADTGKGIPAQDLPYIFDPFYSRKQLGRSGTGLGLTVVMHTMRDHCGFIDISSSENGTVFQLFFPIIRQEPEPEPVTVPLGLLLGKGEKVLIVDDDETQREITASILTRLGYTAYTAANGEQAIQHIKSNPVELLLLDMILEPGMNGYETLKEIRRLIPDQKAVVATGSHNHPDGKRIRDLGVAHYLAKPLSLTRLALAIHQEINN